MTGVEHQILSRGCEVGGISPETLLSPLRDEHVSNVRHAVMYCMRNRAHANFVRIGQIMNRDHSTVIHAVRRVQDLLHQVSCPRVIRDIVDLVPQADAPTRWAPPDTEVAPNAIR